MEPLPLRLRQLSRMLERHLESALAATQAIADDPSRLADALFAEATASDDVVDTESALEYLEGRLTFFGDLVPPSAAAQVREAYRARILAWEQL